MKKYLCFGAVLMALSSGQAAAQDHSYRALTGDRAADFSGPYLGADIGYGFGDSDIGAAEADIDGFEAGVFGGYAMIHPFDAFDGYAAIEGGYNWSDMDGSAAGASVAKDHNWHASLRPGLVLDDAVLAYGVVGYSRAEFHSRGADEDLDGVILGAGAEFSAGMPVNIRVEYLYTDYEEETIGGRGVDPRDNSIRVGAVFHM